VDGVYEVSVSGQEEKAKRRLSVRCLRTFQSYERTNVASEEKLGSEGLHCDLA